VAVTTKLIEEMKKDKELENEFLTFIAERISLRPEIRKMMVSAVLREVATKEDMEKLKKATEDDMDKLRKEVKEETTRLDQGISSLEQRVSSLGQRMSKIEGQLSIMIKMFIAFNVPILVGIIGILLRTYIP
jgi:predicted nuclease with TOPRIM domain